MKKLFEESKQLSEAGAPYPKGYIPRYLEHDSSKIIANDGTEIDVKTIIVDTKNGEVSIGYHYKTVDGKAGYEEVTFKNFKQNIVDK